ncbi:hypothetical protein EYB33_00435 (plasmid) [Lysinibacillus sphaericus]|uniref:hypothetical protein n=1 Tax=Lysinibacillus sphaericus TaxID=1421 RepID=UPI001E4791E3|nr:hypothetical protein [Lysinibacillus sphaericus]UDK94856.1 hypothetical protein EYB33_00435 [Lysinibacillus sphaericus]
MEKVYLSQTDIGKMTEKVGWGDQRKIAVLRSRNQFPKHDVRIGSTKGWKKETIDKWFKEVVEKDLQKRAENNL